MENRDEAVRVQISGGRHERRREAPERHRKAHSWRNLGRNHVDEESASGQAMERGETDMRKVWEGK